MHLGFRRFFRLWRCISLCCPRFFLCGIRWHFIPSLALTGQHSASPSPFSANTLNALGLSITQPLFSFTALEFQNSLSCFLHLRYEDSYLKFVSLCSVPWSPYVIIAAIHPNNQVYYISWFPSSNRISFLLTCDGTDQEVVPAVAGPVLLFLDPIALETWFLAMHEFYLFTK